VQRARPPNAAGRGRGDGLAQRLLAGWRAPGPEFELAAEAFDLHDRIVDGASVDALTGEQTLNVPVASGREQRRRRLARGSSIGSEDALGRRARRRYLGDDSAVQPRCV
jgi:hypothetical protein